MAGARDRHKSAPRAYVTHQDEMALMQAYEFSREALDAGAVITEIASAHRDAVYELLEDTPTVDQCKNLTRSALDFLIECMPIFEAVERGFRDAVEELLHRSESLLQATFDSIQDGIAVLDTDMRILRVNRTMEEWYRHGMPLVGKKCYRGYHGRDTMCEVCPAVRALRQKTPQTDTVPLIDSHGTGRGWLEVHAFPLLDQDGEAVGVVEYLRDITERKRAEETLKRYTEDLTRSNADLERFAYVASHDLQEPLRAIESYVELLGRRYKGRLDADADEFIGFVVDGAQRMRALINDLLLFSRVSTQAEQLEPTSAREALGRALDNLRTAIEESGAVIQFGDLPVVFADSTQLAQVFQNLIGNAIKFRREEPPRVVISGEKQGNEWVFCVSDNGIGIAPEHFERIFRAFERLHARDKYAGTGIGLAICKKIVERHGGRIWVESRLGEGSRFCLTLSEEARE